MFKRRETILNDTILFENKKNIKMSLSIIPYKNLVISYRVIGMNSFDLLYSLGLVLFFLICSTMYNIFWTTFLSLLWIISQLGLSPDMIYIDDNLYNGNIIIELTNEIHILPKSQILLL